jgi:hypothetical protein
VTFEHFKGGKKAPHPATTNPRIYVDDFFDQPTLRKWYATQNTSEVIVDWTGGIPIDGWGMDANGPDPTAPAAIAATGVGCCGCAAADHWQMANDAANARTYKSWGSTSVVELYERWGGYVLGDPSTDNGTNLQDNLTSWRHEPVNGIELAGFGAIKMGTWDRAVRVATMRMFGPLYTGVQLQNAQETQFPGPWGWVPGGSIAGGHCILQAAELNRMDEVTDISWGAAVQADTEFQYDAADEMWALFTPESVDAAGANPFGFNLAEMNEAISSMTGERDTLKLGRKSM